MDDVYDIDDYDEDSDDFESEDDLDNVDDGLSDDEVELAGSLDGEFDAGHVARKKPRVRRGGVWLIRY